MRLLNVKQLLALSFIFERMQIANVEQCEVCVWLIVLSG